MRSNTAVDLAPFGRWTLRDKAAQRRSPLRYASCPKMLLTHRHPIRLRKFAQGHSRRSCCMKVRARPGACGTHIRHHHYIKMSMAS